MNTVSLTCLTTRDYEANARAVDQTLSVLADRINITKLFWFSNRPYPRSSPIDINWVYINPMSREIWPYDYNRVTLDLLPAQLDTDFNLLIHDDGFPVNADAWTDEFFEYDYIGARWYWLSKYNVGNGGFTLRSRRLYHAIQHMKTDIFKRYSSVRDHPMMSELAGWIGTEIIPEDILISVFLRDQLETEYGIRFAPVELADRFSIENFWPTECPWLGKSLGFHGRSGIHRHYGVEV